MNCLNLGVFLLLRLFPDLITLSIPVHSPLGEMTVYTDNLCGYVKLASVAYPSKMLVWGQHQVSNNAPAVYSLLHYSMALLLLTHDTFPLALLKRQWGSSVGKKDGVVAIQKEIYYTL